MAHRVHQIFYDEATRAALHPRLLPLDNSRSPRPDWFEFWPIREYLRSHALDDDTWYGFLSPKFARKFGVDPGHVVGMLDNAGISDDVILMSPHWDQVAYFANAFEQGDFWMPGLMATSQRFVDEIGLRLDLRRLIAGSRTTVFSNYVVAKAGYWRSWLALADALFDVGEARTPLAAELNGSTRYGSASNPAALKTFVQERLACLVLCTGQHRVGVIDVSDAVPLTSTLFAEDPATRRKLQGCDLMKLQHASSGDDDYLRVYRKLRESIPRLDPTLVHA